MCKTVCVNECACLLPATVAPFQHTGFTNRGRAEWNCSNSLLKKRERERKKELLPSWTNVDKAAQAHFIVWKILFLGNVYVLLNVCFFFFGMCIFVCFWHMIMNPEWEIVGFNFGRRGEKKKMNEFFHDFFFFLIEQNEMWPIFFLFFYNSVLGTDKKMYRV